MQHMIDTLKFHRTVEAFVNDNDNKSMWKSSDFKKQVPRLRQEFQLSFCNRENARCQLKKVDTRELRMS